ncbi:phytanoyl-CoA dioxygenase family protein [Simplicispira metamorpha]|uniref:Ectoine hydroxylase-related dioxygenase (Phytanoyl-CoA dioxygenase family) n=1 Tax=Simplicispira metamorpha TaxID=80881 RepID=A0A4R2N1W4_9BURK|nr:phytanoyl-CoA dioxygenase family protein [Simplicispira metamorpha]TCP13536.1 ectoine hydroxylase-related dioxygenase (phytanoyl-CoA dioxygenase family) [Simplicispira metamorpha]
MKDVEFFEEHGYIVLRDFWPSGELDALQAQLDELGKLVVGPGFSSTAQAAAYAMTAEQQSLLYDRLKYLPALSCMSGSEAIRSMCRRLGLQHPSLMGCCNMRLDKPQDSKHLFAWHQDSVYLLGSVNAVTVWVPLHDVNLYRGTIQVIAGSHRRGLAPFKRISDKVIAPYVPMLQRDISLADEVTEAPVTIEAQRGDLVVFKQMLLHRSTPNNSDQIRWTAQLRITDLADPEHRRQRFPTGDKTNIFYVDYPGHDSAARRTQEQHGASIA